MLELRHFRTQFCREKKATRRQCAIFKCLKKRFREPASQRNWEPSFCSGPGGTNRTRGFACGIHCALDLGRVAGLGMSILRRERRRRIELLSRKIAGTINASAI